MNDQQRQIIEGILNKEPQAEGEVISAVMRRALARLCIRLLPSSSTFDCQAALFPTLFADSNAYLFTLISGEHYETLTLMTSLQTGFSSSTLNLGQAFSAYKLFKDYGDLLEAFK